MSYEPTSETARSLRAVYLELEDSIPSMVRPLIAPALDRAYRAIDADPAHHARAMRPLVIRLALAVGLTPDELSAADTPVEVTNGARFALGT